MNPLCLALESLGVAIQTAHFDRTAVLGDCIFRRLMKDKLRYLRSVLHNRHLSCRHAQLEDEWNLDKYRAISLQSPSLVFYILAGIVNPTSSKV